MHKNAATAHEIKIAKIVPLSSVENVNKTHVYNNWYVKSSNISKLNTCSYYLYVKIKF